MNVYSKIRASLSVRNRGRLTKFLVNSGIKPTVNKAAKSPFEKGIIVFSADFEMAWAFRYSKTKQKNAVEIGLAERINVPVLLDLFDSNKLPVTWATVGHLFLKECSRGPTGLPHPEMPRPDFFKNRNWDFSSGDWYSLDPCRDVSTEPAWYASDLIDKILLSEIEHEIGCHTFSHLDFTYKNCPKPLADAELDACIKLATDKGLKLKSMVFPGGTAGNYESLKEKGFICYRKPMKNHLDIPVMDDHGLLAIPSSLGLDKDPYGWSKEFHIKMIRKFIIKTIKYKLVCHFWFHPSMHSWYLENVMPEVVKIAASYGDNDNLEILTMNQVATKYNSIIPPL